MHKNFSRINWFNFTWAFLLIQPIVVPFFKSRGLSLTEIFSVQTAFSLTLSLLDIPTGYLSDVLGRRASLISASILKALGGIGLCYASGWLQVMEVYVLIGIANSLMSGSDVALLFESHEASDRKHEFISTKLFGNRLFYSLFGSTLSAVLGGIIAEHSIETAITANAVFACLPFFVSLRLKNVPREKVHRKRLLKNDLKKLKDEIALAYQPIILAISFSAAPVLSIYIFQSLWTKASLSLSLMGIFAAGFGLMGALVASFANKIEGFLGSRNTRFLIALLPVVAFFGTALLPVYFAFGFGLLIEIQRGLSQTIFIRNLNQSISSTFRASINSVVSFGSRILIAGIAPILGIISEKWDIQTSCMILGGFYFCILLFILYWNLNYAKARRLS